MKFLNDDYSIKDLLRDKFFKFENKSRIYRVKGFYTEEEIDKLKKELFEMKGYILCAYKTNLISKDEYKWYIDDFFNIPYDVFFTKD